MKKSFKVRIKNAQVELSDKDYKAAGGEGTVFVRKGTAFKIYHDPSKMIPEAKIHELAKLNHDEILAPIDVIYDLRDVPIGFTMKYVDGVEFLCKLFTKSFRDDKGISNQDVVDLVTRMQKTLSHIHTKNVLVVDYNEMNFLIGQGFDTIYHIDTDSWQTKSFPARAIMESIRDRLTKPGHFTELTDWFSWAVVTFQMYIGIHPYKGMHPKFKPAEWGKRMEQGISVFDKNVKLPACCQDFTVIPKKHLDWYKEVFIKNDRSIPPLPDAVQVAGAIIRTIVSKGNFTVKQLHEYIKPIKGVYYFNGSRYAITHDGVFKGNDKVMELKGAERVHFEMCDIVGENPAVAYLTKDGVHFSDLDKNPVGQIAAEKMMASNGCIYTVNNENLVENTFERLGKIIHRTRVVSGLSPSYKVFRGVVAQDDFRTSHLAIPYSLGKCINIHVPELDGHRIIDAKYQGQVCILVSEYKARYGRTLIIFDTDHGHYRVFKDMVDSIFPVNFIVLPNKLCLFRDNNKLSLFTDGTQRKEFDDVPFTADMRLYSENMDVMFVDENKIYSIKMK